MEFELTLIGPNLLRPGKDQFSSCFEWFERCMMKLRVSSLFTCPHDYLPIEIESHLG